MRYTLCISDYILAENSDLCYINRLSKEKRLIVLINDCNAIRSVASLSHMINKRNSTLNYRNRN